MCFHSTRNSHPAEVHYDPSTYSRPRIQLESDIGPQVIHLYSITNIRPATVDKADVTFVWPYATLSGDDLLYLLEPPDAKYSESSSEKPRLFCESVVANKQNYAVSRKKIIFQEILLHSKIAFLDIARFIEFRKKNSKYKREVKFS